MRQPSIDKLLKRTDSKYALVVVAAKRARMLTEGDSPLIEKTISAGVSKPVSLALEEIADGKLSYEAPKGGIK
jgi:DNA-directed RNA polymerase subunit omega